MPMPVWIGVVALGLCLAVGVLALTVFLGLVVIASGLAIAMVAGLVSAIRRSLQDGSPDKESPIREEIMEVEEVVTLSSKDESDPKN